jgi:hypothetical protein
MDYSISLQSYYFIKCITLRNCTCELCPSNAGYFSWSTYILKLSFPFRG